MRETPHYILLAKLTLPRSMRLEKHLSITLCRMRGEEQFLLFDSDQADDSLGTLVWFGSFFNGATCRQDRDLAVNLTFETEISWQDEETVMTIKLCNRGDAHEHDMRDYKGILVRSVVGLFEIVESPIGEAVSVDTYIGLWTSFQYDPWVPQCFSHDALRGLELCVTIRRGEALEPATYCPLAGEEHAFFGVDYNYTHGDAGILGYIELPGMANPSSSDSDTTPLRFPCAGVCGMWSWRLANTMIEQASGTGGSTVSMNG